MKKIFLLALLSCALGACAQTTYDITASGGTLSGNITGRNHLAGSSSIVAVQIDGVIEFESGTVSLTTGNRINGSLQTGGQLGAGGSITVTTENEGQIFSGSFTLGDWTVVILANGAHSYILTAAFTDLAGDVGALVLSTTTDPSIVCFFDGSETISGLSLNFTTP